MDILHVVPQKLRHLSGILYGMMYLSEQYASITSSQKARKDERHPQRYGCAMGLQTCLQCGFSK